MSAIATDAQGREVTLIHHRVEPGVGDHANQFAVIRVERIVRQDGDIAMVSRRFMGWFWSEAAARETAQRLDRPQVWGEA